MSLYTREEVAANERLSVRNGAFAMIGITITANYAALFVLKPLHGNSEDVALLNSLPALMMIFATWAGAAWLARTEGKLRFCAGATAAARLFYLLIALAPVLIRGPAVAFTVVLLIAVMNFPQSLSNLSWQSLIGDLVPAERRAGFFSLRNRVLTVVGMLATLVPGLVLQLFPVDSAPPYQVFFFLAAGFSFFEIYYLARHRERTDRRPDRAQPALLSLRAFAGCLRRAPYRRFLLAAALYNLGWQMSWPVFSIYQIQYAGATAIWISAFNVAAQTTQILTFGLWGRLSEKYGTGAMFAASCAGIAVTPALTILSRNLPYLVAINLLSGAFVSGVGMLQFNRLLEVAPEAERTSYIAHFNISLGIVGFIAPQIGVWLLGAIHMDPDMLTSAALRFAGVAALLWSADALRRPSLPPGFPPRGSWP